MNQSCTRQCRQIVKPRWAQGTSCRITIINTVYMKFKYRKHDSFMGAHMQKT